MEGEPNRSAVTLLFLFFGAIFILLVVFNFDVNAATNFVTSGVQGFFKDFQSQH